MRTLESGHQGRGIVDFSPAKIALFVRFCTQSTKASAVMPGARRANSGFDFFMSCPEPSASGGFTCVTASPARAVTQSNVDHSLCGAVLRIQAKCEASIGRRQSTQVRCNNVEHDERRITTVPPASGRPRHENAANSDFG